MAALYLMGEGGAVFSYDDPPPENIYKQWAKGDLVRVDADGSPADEPYPPEDDEDEAPDSPEMDEDRAATSSPRRPNTASSKADWVAYAVAQGMDEDDANEMTRTALIEQFHQKEE